MCICTLTSLITPGSRRTALHLQLTTELVSAASGADAEGAPESMWQHTGASALQHAAEWSSELLAALSDFSAGALTGKAEQPACSMDMPVRIIMDRAQGGSSLKSGQVEII